jgi:ribokinase
MKVTVVGSVNLDFIASAARLPRAGETVTGATLARHPGGKGANQALAAQRLGATVTLLGRVGRDGMADEALALLKAEDVDLSGCTVDPFESTGVALIAVDPSGENQIVVAAGANHAFTPDLLPNEIAGDLICQLELPVRTIQAAVKRTKGFVCVNLAPAAVVSDEMLARVDLIVVNETEAAFYGEALHRAGGRVAVTRGARGAALYQNGRLLAEAVPPKVVALDATGAGDAFVGAITVALLEGQSAQDALPFACAAGALAATKSGAQPSLPSRRELEAILRS